MNAEEKLSLIKAELYVYNLRPKKEQRKTAWITVEDIEKIVEEKY